MELIDFIVIGIIAVIVGGAVAYIIKAKKSGKKCIGCPYADSCRLRSCCSTKQNGEEESTTQK